MSIEGWHTDGKPCAQAGCHAIVATDPTKFMAHVEATDPVESLVDTIDGVIEAWTDAGSHPTFHMRMQNSLRSEWPTLAGAIESLIKADKENR